MMTEDEKMNLGSEVRITLEGCELNVLNSPDILSGVVRDICTALEVEIRAETCHTFEPHGVSVIAILAESHCAIHTWPEEERRTATVDIFTCGAVDPVTVVPLVTRALGATSSNFTVTERPLATTPTVRTYPGFPEYILSAPPYGHFPRPTFRRGVGREYLLEPEGMSWSRFFTSDSYRPPVGKDILLLHPCSWAKPYDFSEYIARLREVTDLHDRVHRVIVSNVGLVPFEYQMNEFFCSYDYMDVSGGHSSEEEDPRALFRALTSDRIREYVFAHREHYKAIVLLGHPVAHGYHEAVSKVSRESGLIGFQAPRAETYRAAVQESRGERDSDAPFFTARSLEELSRGLGAVEKELNK